MSRPSRLTATPGAGYWRWVHAPGRVHFEQRQGRDVPVRFSGLVFDLTEQVQSAQRLQASKEARHQVEERLVMAMESSSLGWWNMDARTHEIFWSQSARQMFDMDQDDVALQAPLSRLHPEDRPRVEAAIAQAQDPCGSGDYHAAYRVVWRDGSVHWIDAVGRVHFDAGPLHQARRFSGVLWDVTAQHELLQSLKDSDRHKNVFLATLAHELHNPLAPIRNGLESLRRDVSVQSSSARARAMMERTACAPGTPGRRLARRLAHQPRQGGPAARMHHAADSAGARAGKPAGHSSTPRLMCWPWNWRRGRCGSTATSRGWRRSWATC